MIRTIRPLDRPGPGLARVAKANGFWLHAGASCEGHERNKPAGVCPYIARSSVAIARPSLSSTGRVVYSRKTPYRDAMTQVGFEPADSTARLAALVPKPRVNPTRYHDVIALNHRWRRLVTPARRGKGIQSISSTEVRTPTERHAARAGREGSGCFGYYLGPVAQAHLHYQPAPGCMASFRWEGLAIADSRSTALSP